MPRVKIENSIDRFIVVAAVLLFSTFAISLVLFFVFEADRVERVLFFPGNISQDIFGEERVLRNYSDTERDMRLLVEETILGPTSLYRSRVLPKQTEIQLFMLRGDVAYIDLSREALSEDGDVHIDFDVAESLLRRALHFNFRSLDEVVITVDGQLPGEPRFTIEKRQNEA
ncbi:MAG: GerMN domain-containing protein [Spirochaetia bacterium]